MSKIHVYLAGPITHCTDSSANDWRTEFSAMLKAANPNFIGVSPLRCEPIIGDKYNFEYADPRFGTPEVIQAKNLEDVERCDVTVAYMPLEAAEIVGHISVGTVSEINWAYMSQKLRILITDIDYVTNNAVMKAVCPWRFGEQDGFENALDVISGIFSVYS